METEVIKDCECYEQREGYRESGRKKGEEWERMGKENEEENERNKEGGKNGKGDYRKGMGEKMAVVVQHHGQSMKRFIS